MDRTNGSQPKPPRPSTANRPTPILSEHKLALQKPETQTSAETGTHSAENDDNVILVIRTPTIRKIMLRPLSRQCPQESIGAAAGPDGVHAEKLQP